ncbi:AAA family ATPase [Mycoplasmopsis fermentans]|uniref:AAA family ATPase n=1 Tax=Mycoplasmopsis fermentans TaxID=2115 RepID=UPI00117FB604
MKYFFYNYLIQNNVDINHIISLSFDNLKTKELLDATKAYNHIKKLIKDQGIYYLLLDEIQNIKDFPLLLNSLLD